MKENLKSIRDKYIGTSGLKIGNGIAQATKVIVASLGGVLLFGTACSLNLGPALIKTFQIIDLLGKLYFLPIVFSPLLDFFLEKVYSLSDFIEIGKYALVPAQIKQPTVSHRKLTSNNISPYLLQS